jgi:hypothetical protein
MPVGGCTEFNLQRRIHSIDTPLFERDHFLNQEDSLPKILRSIEKDLAEANRRLSAATDALAPKHQGGEVEEFHKAHDRVLRLERELAEVKKEPYAVPCDFPVDWDVGAPCPFLLCNDHRTFLTFYVNEPDPNWDGTYVNIVDPGSSEVVALCLVTFEGCESAKLGHPNDEVQFGHPLKGRGLVGYTAQIVKKSQWIQEVAKTNSVHHNDHPKYWSSLNHYVFWFHDSTFECLAKSYKFEVTTEPMSQLLNRIQTKLLE